MSGNSPAQHKAANFTIYTAVLQCCVSSTNINRRWRSCAWRADQSLVQMKKARLTQPGFVISGLQKITGRPG
ncbi:hypothetical protein [uncultured Bradyrhizobium sp.]|jgi:hypothetical protein|uniref:hypothetical protein n=1 Tax=uncultured Bradyrhizobium sp. TaxID=199684 RepID=UPI00260AAE9E|nr:hypothetical protein [uncultured Bradyrhizobium sp.]